MATGGRIRHHLKHNLWRKEAAVVFVGFAAHGTLARRIIDGQNPVRIFGKKIDVRAQIYTIGGFSAHGDQEDLLHWHSQTGNPELTFLVHGEEKAMQTLSGLLENTQVEMPELHQVYELK
jgi:metallo-beta-lactamase family protein